MTAVILFHSFVQQIHLRTAHNSIGSYDRLTTKFGDHMLN